MQVHTTASATPVTEYNPNVSLERTVRSFFFLQRLTSLFLDTSITVYPLGRSGPGYADEPVPAGTDPAEQQ